MIDPSSFEDVEITILTPLPWETILIKPTIGRIVLVYRVQADPNLQWEQARICYVHSDTSINVAGEDKYGLPFQITMLELRQGDIADDPVIIPNRLKGPDNFACWMPFQRKQAEVAEAKNHVR